MIPVPPKDYLWTQPNFNEQEWLRLLFLLADTQQWLNDMAMDVFKRIPSPDRKKFLRRTYYLTPSVLAHIIERHYYRINRYPHAGKFHIPVIEIVDLIREAHAVPAIPEKGTLNFKRFLQKDKTIGYDKYGNPTNTIMILNDAGGRIITAFPAPVVSNSHDTAIEKLNDGLSIP